MIDPLNEQVDCSIQDYLIGRSDLCRAYFRRLQKKMDLFASQWGMHDLYIFAHICTRMKDNYSRGIYILLIPLKIKIQHCFPCRRDIARACCATARNLRRNLNQ